MGKGGERKRRSLGVWAIAGGMGMGGVYMVWQGGFGFSRGWFGGGGMTPFSGAGYFRGGGGYSYIPPYRPPIPPAPPGMPPIPPIPPGGAYGDWRDVAYTNTLRKLYLSMMHDEFMDKVQRHYMRKRVKWIVALTLVLITSFALKLTPLGSLSSQTFGLVNEQRVDYAILHNTRRYQIRDYPRAVVAQVCGLSDKDAFQRLARYSGYRTILPAHNRGRVRLKRTVPIVNSRSLVTVPDDSPWTIFGQSQESQDLTLTECMQWILPGNTSLYDAPKPYDRRVQLVWLTRRQLAVSRWFKGRVNYTTSEEKAYVFFDRLEKDGFKVDRTQWQLFRYNDAITIPRYRRNEIAVPVLNAYSVLGL